MPFEGSGDVFKVPRSKKEFEERENDELVFYVNGRKVVDRNVDPELTLLLYLREVLFLGGTKLSCGEGACGACTVMLSNFDETSKKIRHYCVTSCLVPVCSVHGMAVTTIEGVGSVRDKLHPIQEILIQNHGLQCGFCTPGMVMTMYTLLRNNPKPAQQEIDYQLTGMICRCTGYRAILQGFYGFSQESICGMNNGASGCCRSGDDTNGGGSCCSMDRNDDVHESNDALKCETQDFIYPPELLTDQSFNMRTLVFKGPRVTWIRPTSLKVLLEIKKYNPEAKLVAGNNALGLTSVLQKTSHPIMVSVAKVEELCKVVVLEDKILVGASVTMTNAINALDKLMLTLPTHATYVVRALKQMMLGVGGPQTRNTATFGGHLVAGLVTSYLIPPFIAAGSDVLLVGEKGTTRTIPVEQFCLPDREVNMKDTEIISAISIPLTRMGQYFGSYRTLTQHRRDTEIDVICAGMKVRFNNIDDSIDDLVIRYGGIGLMASSKIQDDLRDLAGRKWEKSICEDLSRILHRHCDIIVTSSVATCDEATMQEASEFKLVTMKNFFFQFFTMVNLEKSNTKIDNDTRMGLGPLQPIKATQIWQHHTQGAIGQPIRHTSSAQLSTGEAVFVDDIPSRKDELFMALLTSSRPHAKIRSINTTAALAMKGVVCFVDADAVAGKNNIFIGSADQKIFADDEVTCVGHIIGGIVAEDMHIARRAVKRIDVDYEELEAILTIEDSIEKGSFYHDRDIDFEGGDISAGFAASDDIIEGETRLGEQEHFYMEPHSCLAIPDVGEYTMELHAAGHDLCSLKYAIANALGSDYSKINCKTTRLGGSFGGKESYAILFGTICAVAANTVKKPVRLVLERDEDMKISGKRMGCLAKYKAGFTKQGDIKAVDLHVYFHGGHTEEHQFFTMLWAYYSFGNVYNICNLRYAGRLCRTNMPSNTAFRGYGQPESVFIMESLLTQIAAKCNIGQTKIREIQFQKEGDLTIHGDQVKNSCINQCWRDCLLRSDFYNRQEDVLKFNRMHKWLKKGLAVVPVAYGFGPPFKKGGQGFAYVQVQMDGSVLISSGGVEMGQGLHTKLIQIASYELDVPTDYIYMSDTSTNVSPFFAATIQSVSTEVSGKAVKIACEKIREQMKPYVSANPNGTWKDRVRQVYDDGEIILATGHSAIAPVKDSNMPFRYYSYGTACSEVELDCLTGEHRLLRTDIVMDCGRSLNPAIDIGQIEGAFVQGYGYFMREEIMWSDKGELINSGPGMYRLPRVQDIPREFNVEILKNSDNPCNIYSSKGIGEPPLSLAVSAFFALKEAIRSARRDIGIEADFSLDAPAVPRRVLQACGNQLLKK